MLPSKLISKCIVEVGDRFRLTPAGLYKYRLEELSSGNLLTFRVSFGVDAGGIKSVQITIQNPFKWDGGELLVSEERDLFLSVVDSAFVAKGFKCYWVPKEDDVVPPRDNQVITIEDTPGGKWLDEASKRDDISDDERLILWAEAERMFRLAGENN